MGIDRWWIFRDFSMEFVHGDLLRFDLVLIHINCIQYVYILIYICYINK